MWIIVSRHVWRCRFRGSLRDEGFVVAPRRDLTAEAAEEMHAENAELDSKGLNWWLFDM